MKPINVIVLTVTFEKTKDAKIMSNVLKLVKNIPHSIKEFEVIK